MASLPHLNINSNNLVFLFNLPLSIHWRDLKAKAEAAHGPVRFVESFEAWLHRPIGCMILDFRTRAAASAFARAVAAGRVPGGARDVHCRYIEQMGSTKFFEFVRAGTGVDLLACGGKPPFYHQNSRGGPSPTSSSGSGSSPPSHRYKPYNKPVAGVGAHRRQQFLWKTAASGNTHLLSIPQKDNSLGSLPAELRSLQLKLLSLIGPPSLVAPSFPAPARPPPLLPPTWIPPPPLPTIPFSRDAVNAGARAYTRINARAAPHHRNSRRGIAINGLRGEIKKKLSPLVEEPPRRRRKQRWDVRPSELELKREGGQEKEETITLHSSSSSSDNNNNNDSSDSSSVMSMDSEDEGGKKEAENPKAAKSEKGGEDTKSEPDQDGQEEEEEEEDLERGWWWNDYELVGHGEYELDQRKAAEKEQQEEREREEKRKQAEATAEEAAEDADAEVEQLLEGGDNDAEEEGLMDMSPEAMRALLGDDEEEGENENTPSKTTNNSAEGGERVVESIRRMCLDEQQK